MNAVRREECEATVLTDEAIEIHLSYMRPAVEAMQAELPALRKDLSARIDAQYEKLNEKIDVQYEKLNDKIDIQHETLNRKIDVQCAKLSGKIDAQGERLDGKIDKLAERVLEMQGNQKGLILFITICGLLITGSRSPVLSIGSEDQKPIVQVMGTSNDRFFYSDFVSVPLL